MTVPLLTSTTGEKLGKSAGNAVWLSGSSYQLYQHLLAVPDQDVEALLTSLTFLPLPEVTEVMDQHRVSPTVPQISEFQCIRKEIIVNVLLHFKSGFKDQVSCVTHIRVCISCPVLWGVNVYTLGGFLQRIHAYTHVFDIKLQSTREELYYILLVRSKCPKQLSQGLLYT